METRVLFPIGMNVTAASYLCAPLGRYRPGRGLWQLFYLE